jgi:hypothetical protein
MKSQIFFSRSDVLLQSESKRRTKDVSSHWRRYNYVCEIAMLWAASLRTGLHIDVSDAVQPVVLLTVIIHFVINVHIFLLPCIYSSLPITMAARSKAWTVFARSNAGIVGSNPTQGWMSVCVYSVFMLSCVGSGLATGWSPVRGVLPTVCRIKKLKKRPRSNKRTVEL